MLIIANSIEDKQLFCMVLSHIRQDGQIFYVTMNETG